MCDELSLEGLQHRRKNLFTAYFILLLVSLSLQNVTVAGPIKIGHIIVLLSIPFFFRNGVERLRIPPVFLDIFFCYIVVVSLCAIPGWGFSSLLINYIFNFYLIVLIINEGNILTKDSWLHLLRVAACIVFSIVICDAIIYRESIISFYNSGYYVGHPSYPTIFSGGVNMESSWISLFGVLFATIPSGIVYIVLSLFLSIVLTSRSGILIALIALVLYIVHTIKESRTSALCALLFLIVMGVVVSIIGSSSLLQPLIFRFSDVGNDPGSVGREEIYTLALPFLSSHIWGVGAGNAVEAINRQYNGGIVEDNVHNLYLQTAIDFGIIGAFIFIALVVYLLLHCLFVNRLSNEFENYVALFLVIALVQFRSFESYPAICLSIALSQGALGRDSRQYLSSDKRF